MNITNKHNGIYIIGGRSYLSYVNWMLPLGFRVVNNIEDAVVVVGCGGEDVDPSIYKHKAHHSTYSNISRDIFELREYKKAIALKRPIWGTCRFAQFLCAMQEGGFLIQDMRHPYFHEMVTDSGQILPTNSLHHQMACLNGIANEHYRLLAYADNISPYHYTGDGDVMPLDGREAEVVYYTRDNAIGSQNHVEMMFGDEKFDTTVKWSQDLFLKLVSGRLAE